MTSGFFRCLKNIPPSESSWGRLRGTERHEKSKIVANVAVSLATVLAKYHHALKKLNVFMKGDDAL